MGEFRSAEFVQRPGASHSDSRAHSWSSPPGATESAVGWRKTLDVYRSVVDKSLDDIFSRRESDELTASPCADLRESFFTTTTETVDDPKPGSTVALSVGRASNRDAAGARVRLSSGGRTQVKEGSPRVRKHFFVQRSASPLRPGNRKHCRRGTNPLAKWQRNDTNRHRRRSLPGGCRDNRPALADG